MFTKLIKTEAAKAAARQMKAYVRSGAVGCDKCGLPYVDHEGIDTFLKRRHECRAARIYRKPWWHRVRTAMFGLG